MVTGTMENTPKKRRNEELPEAPWWTSWLPCENYAKAENHRIEATKVTEEGLGLMAKKLFGGHHWLPCENYVKGGKSSHSGHGRS
jgi:hypothetical protein